MMHRDERVLEWASGTRDKIRSFPENVRLIYGHALYKAQLSERHEIASTMKGSLRGVIELAKDDSGDAYRLYYTLKCPGRIYILYCHKKKSTRGRSIPRREADLIGQRFKDALVDCREREGFEDE